MNNEQFEKLYNLLTGCCVALYLIMLMVFLFLGIYFINLYYDEKDKQDKKAILKREKELRDKAYLSDIEHRLRNLESKDK